MRAISADVQGFVDRAGVKIGYEVYGPGEPTILLAPTWAIVDSRLWKAQVPYLARHFRVITVDPRGNGRSDRPETEDAYADVEYVDDLIAVLDAVGQERAVVVGLCSGAWWGAIAASRYPDRVQGLVALSPIAFDLGLPLPELESDFESVPDNPQGWAKYNRHFWLHNYREFLDFYFATLISEPHSSKQREDAVGWGLQITPETLITTEAGQWYVDDRAATERLLRSVSCPVLVIHGESDQCIPHAFGQRFAELTGGEMITVSGGGHILAAREPVAVNRWIREFATALVSTKQPRRRWTRPLDRRRRALYLSSPIGLGHARRDIAIADELRRLHPDLQIDWLAQHPVTELLERHGEHVHPASAWLASESAHVESESGEHDLHAFQAIRRMDEILLANFMVFDDLVSDEHYDVWIGDEAWDVDYFLHENPELKRSAFVWMTDFVGWLPMASGGDAEAALTADYNAEMVEQIARFPRMRDRALFVGNPEDVVPAEFGPGLPLIREWANRNFDFTGYVTGFPPSDVDDRARVRAALGYSDGERVCVVSVGGSGVGGHLLRRVMTAYPAAARRIDGLRMIVVTGPRIDPASLPAMPGVEVQGFVPDLHRHLAACDIAIVQGGLTTTMELTAARRPFIYVPLRNHFEQNLHVRHRLERHGAGRCMDYAEMDPDIVAEAIVAELGRTVDYDQSRPTARPGPPRASVSCSDPTVSHRREGRSAPREPHGVVRAARRAPPTRRSGRAPLGP